MTISRHLARIAFAAAIVVAACSVPTGGGPSDGASGDFPSQPPPASSPSSVAAPPPPTVAAFSDDVAWGMLVPGDPASISYPSLAAIAGDADAVVLASPGQIAKGPEFTDEYGNVIYFATLPLKVERVIRGTVNETEPGALTLRIWLGVGDSDGYDYSDTFARLAASRLTGRAIFFLANMAALNTRMGGPANHFQADPDAYQVLGGQGFLREVGGRVQPPHLPEDVLAAMAGTWPSGLRGRPFDEVVHSLDQNPT